MNNIEKKYTLIASNKSGATITYNDDTISGCIWWFDSFYTRKGFSIKIIINYNQKEIQIKKTYR